MSGFILCIIGKSVGRIVCVSVGESEDEVLGEFSFTRYSQKIQWLYPHFSTALNIVDALSNQIDIPFDFRALVGVFSDFVIRMDCGGVVASS